jgi:hypothetical protein
MPVRPWPPVRVFVRRQESRTRVARVIGVRRGRRAPRLAVDDRRGRRDTLGRDATGKRCQIAILDIDPHHPPFVSCETNLQTERRRGVAR